MCSGEIDPTCFRFVCHSAGGRVAEAKTHRFMFAHSGVSAVCISLVHGRGSDRRVCRDVLLARSCSCRAPPLVPSSTVTHHHGGYTTPCPPRPDPSPCLHCVILLVFVGRCVLAIAVHCLSSNYSSSVFRCGALIAVCRTLFAVYCCYLFVFPGVLISVCRLMFLFPPASPV